MTVLSDQLRTHYFAADTPNIDTTGTAEFIPAVPVTIYEIGVIATTAVVHNSADVVITATKRPVAGSAANAETLKVWTVVPNGDTLAAGKGSKTKLSEAVAQTISTVDNSLLDESPTGPFTILPGESLNLAVTTAAASGAVVGWVRYSEGGLNGDTEMVNYEYVG